MKKILVPTDFSTLSDNALDYAVQLAQQAEAKLLLFHSTLASTVIADPLSFAPTEEELERRALTSLKKLEKSIIKTNPKLHVEFYTASGIAAEEISRFAEKEQVDIIVVGTQGAGYLEERVLGSTATSLIRQSKIPVMVIDKAVLFKEPKNIVLAVDFAETDNKTVLKPLKQLTKLFKSHIHVLNVFQKAEAIPTIGQITESLLLEHSLKFTHHSYFYRENADVIAGINDFVEKHEIDLVVMISRNHSVVSRLFREPHTQAMAFHSKVPFLSLHE